MEEYIDQELTIPEIHKLFPHLTYDVIYDYIADDTFLSQQYREKGQLKVRKKKGIYVGD